jgi:hypothetical protein
MLLCSMYTFAARPNRPISSRALGYRKNQIEPAKMTDCQQQGGSRTMSAPCPRLLQTLQ